MPDSKKRDLILMKLNEDAHRKYADDVPPIQPHEIDFETKVATLQKLFASKKTLIRRRYECLRIICPPLTASDLPFRDYASKIKRMDEDALLKELDYTALKTLQFVAGLQDPSLRENVTARKMDNADMEGSHEIHVVRKKKVKGLYRYNRLPFGVKSAPGISQPIMDSMICGLEGVAIWMA
ncbi:hypothetical protein ANCCAN_00329 [Ancylostoma caninum]|uniref:Reverse transcriptase domain-containing protein n=1 Tax=Ancylostoma caninum TaxID=29170 RepID=A0A368HCA4_ANCCA|nr:hypothetical protein ANCCAN_00329 [Ancylostoma caninum]